MFTVTKNGTDRIDIELSGKLDSVEMTIALDELIANSEGIKNGKMLYDIIDFHLPSLGAIAIEFSRLPSMFGFIRKFERAAVLSDTNWINKISELEGKLIPGLEIKAFLETKKRKPKLGYRSREVIYQDLTKVQKPVQHSMTTRSEF